MPGRVLIVDDDADMCQMLEDDLRGRGFQALSVTAAESAFEMVQRQDFDVVLTDLQMPGMNGLELCRRVADNRPDVPVVVLTAFGSMDTAIEAIRAGAFDFVTKPVELDLLAVALERAARQRQLQDQVKHLSEQAERAARFEELIGESPAMQRLYDQLNRIAGSGVPVLISGETGTGKELVARALHVRSARRSEPFVGVNCAAIPAALLESELFGHVRGAFTGADSNRQGLFVQANGGTLFLDEIGEMPLELQPKLLRALDSGKTRPVGGSDEVRFDVQLLTATNRDLESAVEAGTFRADLFYRVNVIRIDLPPLRARGRDVLLLAQHYVEHFSWRQGRSVRGISPPAAECFLRYDWPGNVRELRNAVERAVALATAETLTVEDLPDRIRHYRPTRLVVDSHDPSDLPSLAEVERRYIRHVLESLNGNKTEAARVLGVDRKTLYRKLGAEGS